MVSSNESLALNLLDEHDSILKKHIAKDNGKIIKHIGDAVFAEFEEVHDAVESAIKIQKELKKRNDISTGKNKILIRIGIHYGNVIEKDNDLFGHDVNVCARIEGHSFIGSIAISNHALSRIKDKEYFTRSYGYVKLKNISDAIELFKIYIDKNEFLEETEDVFINYIKNKGFNIVDIESYISKHIISIGVLYPNNLGNSTDDFFCYAFLDQIIKDLQKSRELRIPNIFDVQKFKDSDLSVSEISRKLNVENIIQTSIIKDNNNIKINIQILSIETGEIIIQETWDGKVNDLTKISGKIGLLILDHFSLDIPKVLKDTLDIRSDINEEAYKYFLEGHYIFNHIKGPEDYKKSKELFEKAISLDDNYVAPHYMLGMTLNSMGKFDDAEEELDIAQEIAEDIDNIKALANVYNYKGVYYRFKGQFKKSIRFFEKGLKHQKEIHDELTEASILNNMSMCFANSVIDEHDKALQLLKRSKEIYKNYEMFLPLANSYAETGGVYKNLNQFTNALENYERAVQFYNNEDMHLYKLQISIIMADIYNSLGMPLISRKYLDDSREYAESFNNQLYLGRFYFALAKSYEVESKLNLAIECMEKTISYYNHLNKNNLMVPCLINLSYLYYKNNNIDKANESINQSDSILQSRYFNEIFSVQTIIYKNLYQDKDKIDKNAIEIAFNTAKEKEYNEIFKNLADVYKKVEDVDKFKECIGFWNKYVKEISSNIIDEKQSTSYLKYNLIT